MRSVSPLSVTRSTSFFSSDIMARMTAASNSPRCENCFSLCACDSDGVACSLSIALRKSCCSSLVRNDSS